MSANPKADEFIIIVQTLVLANTLANRSTGDVDLRMVHHRMHHAICVARMIPDDYTAAGAAELWLIHSFLGNRGGPDWLKPEEG